MLETALFARLSPKLKAWGAVDRVENSQGSGMWDCHTRFEGIGGWIETKMEKGGKLYFERFQPNFARRQLRAGATNLFVIAGRDSRNGYMAVYHASTVLAAPMTFERKWKTVRVEDLEPCLEMTKQYNWDALRLLLSSPYTRHPDT
jgi:hypothetical protein